MKIPHFVIQSEAKDLENIKQWMFPRSFLPTVVWMTKEGINTSQKANGEGGEGFGSKLPCI